MIHQSCVLLNSRAHPVLFSALVSGCLNCRPQPDYYYLPSVSPAIYLHISLSHFIACGESQLLLPLSWCTWHIYSSAIRQPGAEMLPLTHRSDWPVWLLSLFNHHIDMNTCLCPQCKSESESRSVTASPEHDTLYQISQFNKEWVVVVFATKGSWMNRILKQKHYPLCLFFIPTTDHEQLDSHPALDWSTVYFLGQYWCVDQHHLVLMGKL